MPRHKPINDLRYTTVGNEPLQPFENLGEDKEGFTGIINYPVQPQPSFEMNSLVEPGVLQEGVTPVGRLLSTHKIIHGPDDRIHVPETEFPYRMVCLLQIWDAYGRAYTGTGFFIAPRCVITNGHCVFIRNQWAQRIRVIPGAQGDAMPYGSAVSSRFRSVRGWIEDRNTNFDYAAILLDSDDLFRNVQSCFGYDLPGAEERIVLAGYPSDKKGTQWKSEGTILRESKFRLYYELDTVIGNSGSPVFVRRGDSIVVIGVHSQGEEPNYAVKVTEDLMGRLKEWSKL